MDDIKNNLDTILNQICETANQSSREADSVKLIAVSKKKKRTHRHGGCKSRSP